MFVLYIASIHQLIYSTIFWRLFCFICYFLCLILTRQTERKQEGLSWWRLARWVDISHRRLDCSSAYCADIRSKINLTSLASWDLIKPVLDRLCYLNLVESLPEARPDVDSSKKKVDERFQKVCHSDLFWLFCLYNDN